MAGNFFKQRMSYSIQNGKEKCVLNTIIDEAIFGKIFFLFLLHNKVISGRVTCFL